MARIFRDSSYSEGGNDQISQFKIRMKTLKFKIGYENQGNIKNLVHFEKCPNLKREILGQVGKFNV